MGKNKKGCREYFGERLKSLRAEKGISQKALADELGISKGAVSFYETCQNAPDIEILDAVSNYFKVSYDYLLGRTPNKTTNTELQAVCKYTGLSEKSIENIRAITKSGWDMNLLLESNELKGVVEMLNKIKTISVGRRYHAARIEGGFEDILDILSGDLHYFFSSAVREIERFALSGGDVSKDYIAFSPEDLSYDNFSKITPPLFFGSSDRNYDMMLSLAEFQLNQKKFNKLVEDIKNDTSTDEEQFTAFDDDIGEMLEKEKSGTAAAIEEYLKQVLAASQKELKALKGTKKSLKQESIDKLEQLIAFFHNHIRKE